MQCAADKLSILRSKVAMNAVELGAKGVNRRGPCIHQQMIVTNGEMRNVV